MSGNAAVFGPESFQLLEHLIVRETARPGENDLLRTCKEFAPDDRLKSVLGANPHLARIIIPGIAALATKKDTRDFSDFDFRGC